MLLQEDIVAADGPVEKTEKLESDKEEASGTTFPGSRGLYMHVSINWGVLLVGLLIFLVPILGPTIC